jgi:hypothetical protein
MFIHAHTPINALALRQLRLGQKPGSSSSSDHPWTWYLWQSVFCHKYLRQSVYEQKKVIFCGGTAHHGASVQDGFPHGGDSREEVGEGWVLTLPSKTNPQWPYFLPPDPPLKGGCWWWYLGA